MRLIALLALLFVSPLSLAQQAGQEPEGEGRGLASMLRGLRLDLSVSNDSNVSRSNLPAQRLADQSIGMQIGASKVSGISDNSQIVMSGFAGLEQFRRLHGLGKVYAGGEMEYQYRTSEEFDAPTFGISGSAVGEDFQSGLRDGIRFSIGTSVRMALTDRINLFAAFGANARSASSAVFETRDRSLRFNLDYALTPNQTLYLGGEARSGDIVSSGRPSLANFNLAKVLVADDALSGAGYNSYRFAGRTALFTLGFNLAFGPKEALDISWRHVRSDPKVRPTVPVGGPSHYLTNQVSVVYLKSF